MLKPQQQKMSERIERARSNKKAQEHAQSALSPHTLYIALSISLFS